MPPPMTMTSESGHAGHAAHQEPAPTVGFFEEVRANLDRHAARHLAHRLQERKRPVGKLDGFVGDGLDLAVDQGTGQRFVGGQVQVGEEHLLLAEQAELVRAPAP